MKRAIFQCFVVPCIVMVCLCNSGGPGIASNDDRSESSACYECNNVISIGIGVPHAVFGISYEREVDLNDNISIGPTAAIGYTFLSGAGVAWQMGLQAHFLKSEALFRPAISIWYGTNHYLEEDYEEYVLKENISVGAGGQFQFGNRRNHGLSLYALYLHYDLPSGYEDESPVPHFDLSVGYFLKF